jgi:hypothetical protein
MEPEGSLPCSQEPSTGPYPEPDQSSPYNPILSLVRPILILSTRLGLGLPRGLFPYSFPTKILYAFPFFYRFSENRVCMFEHILGLYVSYTLSLQTLWWWILQ